MGCKHSKVAHGDPGPSAAQQSSEIASVFPRNHPVGINVEDDYLVTDLLGKGSFGSVYLGTHRRAGNKLAVKVMDRSRIKSTSIEREWTVLEHLGHHEHVVGFHGAYANAKEVCFTLELMKGGELFDRLIKRGAYSEAEAREPFRQVASALKYLHGRGIIHRDLKPENLLLADETLTSDVKIADFGLSQLIKRGQKLTKVCGTWAYAAPEMSDPQSGGYDCRFDTWGYGVILFVVLCGYHPFDPEGGLPVPEIKARARGAVFDFDQPEWDCVSDLAKDLLRKLIVKNPAHRLRSSDILKHPWFTQDVPHQPINPDIGVRISEFQIKYRRKLKASIYGSFFITSLRTMSVTSMKRVGGMELPDGREESTSSRPRGGSSHSSGQHTSGAAGVGLDAHGTPRRLLGDDGILAAARASSTSSSSLPATSAPTAASRLMQEQRQRGSFGSGRGVPTPLHARLPTIQSTSRMDIGAESSHEDFFAASYNRSGDRDREPPMQLEAIEDTETVTMPKRVGTLSDSGASLPAAGDQQSASSAGRGTASSVTPPGHTARDGPAPTHTPSVSAASMSAFEPTRPQAIPGAVEHEIGTKPSPKHLDETHSRGPSVASAKGVDVGLTSGASAP